MPSEKGPQFTSREGKTRKLAYVEEFRNILRESPHMVSEVTKLCDKATQEYNPPNQEFFGGGQMYSYNKEVKQWSVKGRKRNPLSVFPQILVPGDPITQGNLEITVLARKNGKRGMGEDGPVDEADFFKVTIKDKSYFVKKSINTITPGFNEFKHNKRAAEVLKDVRGVEVIDAQLGYQDSHQSWFVSPWQEGLKKDWMLDINNRKNIDKFSELIKRSQEIGMQLDLAQFYDHVTNLFYDPKKDTFILIDATAPSETK